MMRVAIVTDSTASLGPDQAAAAGVTIVPLQVVIGGVSYPETAPEVSPAMVAQALRDGAKVSTSRPSPEAFKAVYADLADRGFEAVVSVHMSSEMSGTCAAAEAAAETASIPVTVVDTQTLAMAAGFGVLAGAESSAAGADADEVAEVVRRRVVAAEMYFYVDTLEYLWRGGRIGAAAALLGSALAMKPLLWLQDGEVQPFERVRTTSKALARLEELSLAALARAAARSECVDVAVHHLDNLAGAERLVRHLSGRVGNLGSIAVSEVSAVLGVHVGPGTLGVVVSPRT